MLVRFLTSSVAVAVTALSAVMLENYFRSSREGDPRLMLLFLFVAFVAVAASLIEYRLRSKI